MLNFSTDPQAAESQMRAIIFYLTTFGYIDGEFDAAEKSFVRSYIEKLVRGRVEGAAQNLAPETQTELVAKYTAHFHEVFDATDTEVKELFSEAVARDEDHDAFVHAKLKLRCFEIFQGFDRDSQEGLMETIDALIMADGEAHPAEVKFRAELADLLESDLGIELVDEGERPSVEVQPPLELAHEAQAHPFFSQSEHHYSPTRLQKQIDADLNAIEQAVSVLEDQAARGDGKLKGKANVDALKGEAAFLDGHTYWCPAEPGRSYELTILGDLHGCYSCLKGAVMQSRFFEKVQAYKEDPERNVNPKLVLLGDYIDRGIFSLNGVLRTALRLLVAAPEHVYVLRGNHEYFVEYAGNVYGGVKPSEAIDTLKPHVPVDVFKRYIALFDKLPNTLLFDRSMFVHGGLPRDRLFKERFEDLSSLNDPELRFQMMWSDPSSADVIPAELQEQSARFPFGRLQAHRFLQKLGCHTLVRGHEKVNEGFRRNYDDGSILLATVFSSGGADNDDLPETSSYRKVTPMALTLRQQDGQSTLTPWAIDYRAYNDPERNAFFKAPPELRHGG